MLIGNLGRDPDLRYTPAGVAVASFTIATNESWKDQDGNLQERTEWHNIAWRKLAEICGEYLKKGQKIYVEGKIQTRSFDDKNTGPKRYVTEIVADNIIMLDRRGGASGEGRGSPAPQAEQSESGGPKEDDLPF